jgi:hypothetical protein
MVEDKMTDGGPMSEIDSGNRCRRPVSEVNPTSELGHLISTPCSSFPVHLTHSVVMRGLDPRIHRLCKVYAKKMDQRVKPRVTAMDGCAPTQIDRQLL